MKPASFEYARPDTLEQALSLLAEHGDRALPLAGGQSLVPLMNLRLAQPAMLVDLNGLSELARVARRSDGLALGALTRQRELERSPVVAASYPILAAAANYIGTIQTRNRGTVGGSLAHADPSAELPMVMLACGATIALAGPGGTRAVPAAEFFLGPFRTARRPDELVVEIVVPPHRAWGFREAVSPARAPATVAVAVVETSDGRRVRAVCGVGDRPILVDSADQLGHDYRGSVARELLLRAERDLAAAA
jgi:carbon-monoxide dehydrogenase medium subunit